MVRVGPALKAVVLVNQLLTVQSPREGQWLSQGLTALLGNTFRGPVISLYADAWLN